MLSERSALLRYAPFIVLALGSVLVHASRPQVAVLLRDSLTELPRSVEAYHSFDLTIPAEERRISGVSDYVLRNFVRDSTDAFQLYVGYYRSQRQGQTIHSPRNCLPGAGWAPVSHQIVTVATPRGDMPVNRYLIANDDERALVYYWYQGRGRIEANEYKVKWHLMRDAAIHGRTEEALVRLVVPIGPSGERGAEARARAAAEYFIPLIDGALPTPA